MLAGAQLAEYGTHHIDDLLVNVIKFQHVCISDFKVTMKTGQQNHTVQYRMSQHNVVSK